MKGQATGAKFWLFNKLVFNTVKKKIGLDDCQYVMSGAAPLSRKTHEFFFSLNIFINNTFGMSETAGPMCLLYPEDYPSYNLKSASQPIKGSHVFIEKNGEACFFGRNIFMGYLKNDQATLEALDEKRHLHSGDIAEFDDKGNMVITGRIKEIMVTAGGENIAPIIIENYVREEVPFCSQAMVIGDQKKFVSCLLTFRVNSDPSEAPSHDLHPECINIMAKLGITGLKTV